MRQWVRAALVLALLALPAAAPATAGADAASYRDLVMADDPAGYWRLDEASGPLGRNEVAGGQRLRYFQHPLLDEDGAFAGSRGASAGFRSLLDLGPPIGPDTDATYETWFKVQAGMDGQNYEHILEVPDDWELWMYNGDLGVGCERGTGAGGPKLTDASWHHIAARLTANRIEVFVDGVRAINTTCDYDRGSDRVLAGWGGGRVFSQPTARAYDEMAMYDRALADDRIAAHAAARTPADAAAPPARAPLAGGAYTTEVLADRPWSYHRLEDRPFGTDGDGTRHVEDASGNGRHAAMSLGGMDRAPGPIVSEARNVSMRPRTHGFVVPAPATADVSVEVWVKFLNANPINENTWIAGGRFAEYFNGEELGLLPRGDVMPQGNLWNDRAWHHVVVTKDTARDKVTVYRDGLFLSEVDDANDAPLFGTDAPSVTVGGGSALLPGFCLDEVALYEGALSAARVAAHYDAADAELATGGCGGTSDVRPDLRPPAPVNTSPPRARGVARPGHVVWCDPGTWSGDPTHFRQTWLRAGVPMTTETEWAYMVTAADDGAELTCEVVATGSGGESGAVRSEPVTASGRPAAPGVPRLVGDGGDPRTAFTLEWDASPADPVPADGYIVEFRDQRGVWHVASRPDTTSATLANQPEGTLAFRVLAQSGGTASDPSPESAPIVVDRTPPAPARLVVAGSPASGDWYRDSVAATWEPDGDPDLADGSPGSGVDPASVPGPVALATSGAHAVTATLRDRAGNQAVTTGVLRVDATAPSVALECPPVAHVGAVAHAAVDASDGESGLDASVPSALTVDTATSGVRTLSVTVRDNVGHERSASCTVPVVHRRPSAPRLVAGTSPGNGAVTLAWSRHPGAPPPAAYVLERRDADDAGWTQVTRTTAESWTTPFFARLPQGTWRFRVRADDPDFSGEWSDVSDPVVVDRTAPSAPLVAADRPVDATPDWYRDSVTVSFQANGDPDLPDGSPGSGVDPASVPASVTRSVAGTSTATGTVRDRAGNTSASSSRTVRVDTSTPSVSLDCPNGDVEQDSDERVDWDASDTGSGLAGPSSGSIDLDTDTIGAFTVSAPPVGDRVGHVAAPDTCAYRVVYDFAGFADPVSNTRYNRVDAGAIVPMIFSLNGDRGLGVISGTPAVTSSNDCNGPREDVSWTLPATWSGLQYLAAYDAYVWAFPTQVAWRNTCRELTIALADGTTHSAVFRFR